MCGKPHTDKQWQPVLIQRTGEDYEKKTDSKNKGEQDDGCGEDVYRVRWLDELMLSYS
jgi:hypothetical protein